MTCARYSCFHAARVIDRGWNEVSRWYCRKKWADFRSIRVETVRSKNLGSVSYDPHALPYEIAALAYKFEIRLRQLRALIGRNFILRWDLPAFTTLPVQ